MKKADVKVGETYLMNHTSGKIHVRILREIKRNRGRIDNPSVVTHWRSVEPCDASRNRDQREQRSETFPPEVERPPGGRRPRGAPAPPRTPYPRNAPMSVIHYLAGELANLAVSAVGGSIAS